MGSGQDVDFAASEWMFVRERMERMEMDGWQCNQIMETLDGINWFRRKLGHSLVKSWHPPTHCAHFASA